MTGRAGGDAPARGAHDDAVVHELARAVTSEHEERAGVAMYLALHDLADGAPAPPAEPAAVVDGADVAAALQHWHGVLGLDDGSDAVQHALAALAASRVRPAPPPADPQEGPAAPYPPYAPPVPGTLGRVVDALCGGRLVRVVNFHNTPHAQDEQLAAELADYAARYVPLRPADVHRFLDTGSWGEQRPGLVVAFFDGYRNNAEVGAPACEAAGIPAWFYLPTAFLDAPVEDQRAFAAAHDVDLVAEEASGSGRLAMTWDEAADLAQRHVVAGHTASHATAASVRTAEDVRREVLDPLRRLEEATGQVPAAFAWLGGTPFDAASPACAAVRDVGVPLLVSGTALERLNRP